MFPQSTCLLVDNKGVSAYFVTSQWADFKSQRAERQPPVSHRCLLLLLAMRDNICEVVRGGKQLLPATDGRSSAAPCGLRPGSGTVWPATSYRWATWRACRSSGPGSISASGRAQRQGHRGWISLCVLRPKGGISLCARAALTILWMVKS